MKIKKYLLIILSFLFVLTATVAVAMLDYSQVAFAATMDEITQSFEDGVPEYWQSASGALSVTDKRYKLGAKSLLWKIGKNDKITIKNEKNMSSLAGKSKIRAGGFVLWVYSEAAQENEHLSFAVGDDRYAENGLSFKFNFKLNFVGWRALWVRLYEDTECDTQERAKFNSGEWEVNAMTVEPSAELRNKSVYFDALQFSDKIFWNRANDYQFNHDKRADDGSEELTNWTGAYLYSKRTPVIPLRKVTDSDRSSLKKIETALKNWMLGTDEYISKADNPRIKGLQKSVTNATKTYESLNIKNNKGVLTGTPLFCSDSPFVKSGKPFTRGLAENVLLPFALDYKLNGNAGSLEKLYNLLDYMHDQGWAYGSGIGSLDHETLRASSYFPAVYLIKDELQATGRLERERKTVEWYCEFGKVYGNSGGVYEQTTADEMRTHFLNRLICVLLTENEQRKVQAMESYVKWVNEALRINANRGDTIKPDYTGFHHNNAYMSAYPPHGYHMAAMINYILSGTDFAFGREAQSNLKNALIVHDVLSNTVTVPLQVRGRFPAGNENVSQEIMPAYAYMALAGNPETGETFDNDMAAIFMRRWNAIGAKRQTAVKGYTIGGISYIHSYGALNVIYEVLDKAVAPAETPSGFWNMPYAGMAVARQDEWLLAVRGFSKYIWDFESNTTDNRYGLYSSYGMINILSASANENGVEIITDKANGYDYQNGWDWNRLSGATCINLPLDVLGGASGTNYNNGTFVGSTGIGNNGVWGFGLNDYGFTYNNKDYNADFKAKKSVFVFGNEIIVLGSDISNSDGEHNTETTLFQNAIYDGKLPITVNGNSVETFPYDFKGKANTTCCLTDPYGNGYYIPDSAGLNVKRSVQSSMASDGKTASSGNYATAWIDHGKSPSSAGYEYVILIKTDSNSLAQYAANKPYMVLKKDGAAHVVHKAEMNATAYAIFTADEIMPQNGIIKSADTPVLIYTQTSGKNTKIAVSDPDLRIGTFSDPVMQSSVMHTVRITLYGKQSLSGNVSGVRIAETGADYTVIEIDCQDGKTVEFETVSTDEVKSAHSLTVEGGNGGGSFKAGDSVTVECVVPEGKEFSHWTVEGLDVDESMLNTPKISIVMPDNGVTFTAHFKEPDKKSNVALIIILITAVAVIATITVIIIVLKNKRKKRKRE